MAAPPPIDGVGASHVQLPPGPWVTVLQALCARFPHMEPEVWRCRFERGRVLGRDGAPLAAEVAYRAGLDVYYYREVIDEAPLAAEERVLYADAHLVVVDKPHFLPVVPAGRFARDTLLARLVRRFDNAHLAPLHRIDRLTAGLVLFSARPDSRDAYQALFRERAIHKRYEALAAPLPDVEFPHVRQSRIEPGTPFFTMREAAGEPNSCSRIDVIARHPTHWHYMLEPVTGRKHQLRVHMAAMGGPIEGDPLYPCIAEAAADDLARPLQLLAKSLEFVDPVDGRARCFGSGLSLAWPG